MISSLRGVVLRANAQGLIVDVGGVGYGVRTPLSTLYELERRAQGLAEGSPVELLIHTQVRDDAIELFGFLTELELDLFGLLISVSGIGPRLAQVILSGLAPEDVAGALSGGDVATLVRIPGIGKKTAERMVLELRDKVKDRLPDAAAGATRGSDDLGPTSNSSDAIQALLALGYKTREAERAVQHVLQTLEGGDGTEAGEPSLQELLRLALRRLSKV